MCHGKHSRRNQIKVAQHPDIITLNAILRELDRYLQKINSAVTAYKKLVSYGFAASRVKAGICKVESLLKNIAQDPSRSHFRALYQYIETMCSVSSDDHSFYKNKLNFYNWITRYKQYADVLPGLKKEISQFLEIMVVIEKGLKVSNILEKYAARSIINKIPYRSAVSKRKSFYWSSNISERRCGDDTTLKTIIKDACRKGCIGEEVHGAVVQFLGDAATATKVTRKQVPEEMIECIMDRLIKLLIAAYARSEGYKNEVPNDVTNEIAGFYGWY